MVEETVKKGETSTGKKFDADDERREDDEWQYIYSLLDEGYEALDNQDYRKVMDCWLSAWEQVKKLLKNAYKKPAVADVMEAIDYEYEIEEWLEDVERVLGNAGEHEKRIIFCREILQKFDWEEDSPGNFKNAIGDALQKLGRKEESRKWFEDWFGEERDNPDCIDSYLRFLLGEEDINGARGLIEEAIPIDMECNMDNQMLFYRAAAFYETIKETENSKMYRDKAEDFHKKFLENPLQFSDDSEDYDFFSVQKPVVKDKKIYPNDPCPCGSGKKYKKCCGK